MHEGWMRHRAMRHTIRNKDERTHHTPCPLPLCRARRTAQIRGSAPVLRHPLSPCDMLNTIEFTAPAGCGPQSWAPTTELSPRRA